MRRLAPVLAAALAMGCATDTASPARTAGRFHEALAAHQGEAACALLAPKTAAKLPKPGQSCAQALNDIPVSGHATVISVQVWGEDALVRLAGNTLFLRRYSQGWRVRAAGCERRGDLPFDCAVED